MQNIVKLSLPENAALLLEQVLSIAIKAHGFSPSPVQIKEELSLLDSNMLEELHEGLSTQIKEQKSN